MKWNCLSVLLAGLSALALPVSAQSPQPAVADYLGNFDGVFAPVMVQHQKKWLHASGKVLLDKTSHYGYYGIVSGIQQDAYGAINRHGKVIVPFKYDAVEIKSEDKKDNPDNNYCFVTFKLNGKTGAADSSGNILLEPVYEDVDALNPRLIKFRKNGLWGWAEMKTGKVIQTPEYENVHNSYVLPGIISVTLNGLTGLARHDGSLLTPVRYHQFYSFGDKSGDLICYTLNNKSGIMDKNGKEVTPALYNRIAGGPSPALLMVEQQDKTGFINRQGKTILAPQYSKAFVNASLVVVWKGNKCGVVNAAGKEVLPTVHDEIEVMDNRGNGAYAPRDTDSLTYFIVAKKAGLAGLFSAAGKPLLPVEYHFLRIVMHHQRPVVMMIKDKKAGLADLSGKILLPVSWDNIMASYGTGYTYNDDRAGADKSDFIMVSRKEKVGLYNLATGREVLPPAFTTITWKSSGLLETRDGDTSSIFTRNGERIRGPKLYGFFHPLSNDLLVETTYGDNGRLTALTDPSGKKLYENKDWEFNTYTNGSILRPAAVRRLDTTFTDGLLKITANRKDNLFIDRQGNPVTFDQYAYVGEFWNGLAIAGKDGKYGIINRKQEEVLPVIYDNITELGDKMLKLSQGERFGVAKKDGTVIIPVQYASIRQIYDTTLYEVTLNRKSGVLNGAGQTVIPTEYDEAGYSSSGKCFKLTRNGKNGLADASGKVIIPAEYEVLNTNRGYGNRTFPVLVKQGEWYFYLDQQGNPLPFKSKKEKGYND
ncbi:WG repeat-containing protein [Chitinophaga solisilvae]|uniref:WG repeat-containing protein n=1 Tax=Chitinophaga solisilvae TaxID=1233460 RepID=UPI00136D9937|nr:WG repeat-containing protein [Chitinophaga solisilvae]